MDKAKIMTTTITSALASLLGALYVPVLLMVVCNIIDYITGLMAAKYRNDGISSYKSMRGITKKVAMWLLVVVGSVIDSLIFYSTQTIGFEYPFKFLVACVVAIWIVCNEIISILENMIDIGVTIPPFIMPLVKMIKEQTEEKMTFDDNKEDDAE